LPQDVKYIKVNKIKDTTYIISISLKGESPVEIVGEKFHIPEAGIKKLSENIKKKENEIIELKKELEKLGNKKEILEKALNELQVTLEFESAKAEMNIEDQLAYLVGYVPVDLVDKVKEAAAANSWALLSRDPDKEEAPPTITKNTKMTELVKPLFKFLDLVPGYREFDVSALFLFFFTIFVGIIVGDAAYGCIILLATIILRIVLKIPGTVFGLLILLSCSTIGWGTITGNWFASETLSEVPFFKSLTIPQLANFGEGDSATLVQQIAFTLAMVQMTIGILVGFVRKLPSLTAFANIGNLLILYGAYFLVQYFIMGTPLHPIAPVLFASGFFVLILFGNQGEKGFFKGVLFGVANSPLTAINSVGLFGDIISYIRLYAVGLAGFSVASSFNNIAMGVGNSVDGVIGSMLAIAILFAAHTFNLMLCALSVIVHAVRLNILEFGMKVGMEWSGYPYNPFKEKSA
jgi:V/A-type H+-transporting ATPase subunit I